jgi:F-type H+-transporting ATPase subunit epsilon
MGIFLRVLSPEKTLYGNDVHMALFPGVSGDFAVLKGHESMISALKPGIVSVFEKEKGDLEEFLVLGGVVEVSLDQCSLLGDEIIKVSEIDKKVFEERIFDINLMLQKKQTQVVEEDLHAELEFLKIGLSVIK